MIITLHWCDVIKSFENTFDEVLNCKGKKAYFDCIKTGRNTIDGATTKWAGMLILDALVHFAKENYTIGPMKSLRRYFNQHALLTDCIAQAMKISNRDHTATTTSASSPSSSMYYQPRSNNSSFYHIDELNVDEITSVFDEYESRSIASDSYYSLPTAASPPSSQTVKVYLHFNESLLPWKSIDSLYEYYNQSTPKCKSKARFIEVLTILRNLLVSLTTASLEQIIVKMIEVCVQDKLALSSSSSSDDEDMSDDDSGSVVYPSQLTPQFPFYPPMDPQYYHGFHPYPPLVPLQIPPTYQFDDHSLLATQQYYQQCYSNTTAASSSSPPIGTSSFCQPGYPTQPSTPSSTSSAMSIDDQYEMMILDEFRLGF